MKKAKLDGVIGIRAQDRRMGGTDESTELWGHLNQNCLLDYGTTFRWVSGHWTTFYIPGPILASLCLFLITIQFQIDKSVDIVLGNWTQGRRMVSADGTTELGWPPWSTFVFWQIGGLHYNLKKLTTGTVVVYTRDLQFESSHWQIVFTVLKSRHQLLTIRYSF